MKNLKAKLKAFTLIEVIIVLALFSLIMFSVVQLLDPVSKFFVRSSNYESTNACLDNISRAVEGNLKYADRVWGYYGYNPYTNADSLRTGAGLGAVAAPTADLKSHVEAFFTNYFKDRRFDSCKGKIHVLIFDNTFDEAALNNVSTLNEFQQNRMNQGMITHLSYTFDTYDANLDEPEEVSRAANSLAMSDHYHCDTWYVNQALYGDFNYKFDLVDAASANNGVTSTTASTTTNTTDTTTTDAADAAEPPPFTCNPEDFAIKITAQQVQKVTENGSQHLALNPSTSYSVANFAMRNVLDANKAYQDVGYDQKLIAVNAQSAADELEHGPEMDPTTGENFKLERAGGIPRYHSMEYLYESDPAFWDGFYFIYTLPDEMQGVESYAKYDPNKYVTTAASTTTTTP